MKKTLLLFIGLMLVAAIGFSSDFTVVKDHFKKEVTSILAFENVTATKAAVIDNLNAVRSDLGLSEVTYEYILDNSAQKWVYELNEDNVVHDLQRSTGQFKAEAILMYEGNLDPSIIISEFMNSPQHKNILTNSGYRKVGVGIKRTSGVNFVVMRFS